MASLSFTQGRPIARVVGGKDNGKIIRLVVDDIDNVKKPKTIGKKQNKKGGCDCSESSSDEEEKPETKDKKVDIYDYIDDDSIKKKFGRKLSTLEKNEIRNALKYKKSPDGGQMKDVYDSTNKDLNKKLDKEYHISDGVIQPLPNDKKTERIYIAGPSDSGKSYYCGKFLQEYRKIYPKKKIYIFSDVDEDEVLDKLEPIRVKLDQELVDNPIKPEELKNGTEGSLCLFDDIDSIENKKLLDAVNKLKDALLKRGRHENITVIVTNHNISDHNKTRVVLNEANSITFFCKSGAKHGNERVMKTYCGLGKEDIKRIFALPSRWVTVVKNSPMYVMYSGGIYLL
jgi:hypothetical protein